MCDRRDRGAIVCQGVAFAGHIEPASPWSEGMRNKTSVLKGNRFPSAAGTMSRLPFARAKAAGWAVDRLLQRAGLSRQQINDPLAMVKAQDQINFLNFVADAVEDEFLGFRLAQSPDLREIGLLYYVLASS